MANFKHSERSQGLFLTVNLEDQLIPGTFEWTVDYLIDEFDMSLFEQNYHNGRIRRRNHNVYRKDTRKKTCYQ
jgi:hypothetical protein